MLLIRKSIPIGEWEKQINFAEQIMTTLGTIRANHLSLTCQSCGHNALLEVAGLLERLSPETTVQQVLQKARCNRCKVKSNSDCQIIFVGGSLEALKGSKGNTGNLG